MSFILLVDTSIININGASTQLSRKYLQKPAGRQW